MTPDDGTLGLGARFQGVEDTLKRIETKLDSKVDQAEFRSLASRVEQVESGETPLSKFFREQYTETQRQVNDLVVHGSARAQETTKELSEVKKSVEVLKYENQTRGAIQSNKNASATRTYKIWGIVFGAVTALSASASAVAVVLSLAHHAG